MKYLVRQAKKTYFEKIVSNETDNTCLVWKALNALTKNTFTCKQNIQSTLTAEIVNDHLLSLAKTLTKTLHGWGGGGVNSTNVPMNLRIFAQKGLNLMTPSSSLKLQLTKLVNMYPVLVSKKSSGCDGISDKIILLSLPYIVQHLTYVCRGAGWGVEGKQVGSMDEEPQVRGCNNITFICTPTNQETVSVLKKTQAKKKFRTWKQM